MSDLKKLSLIEALLTTMVVLSVVCTIGFAIVYVATKQPWAEWVAVISLSILIVSCLHFSSFLERE